MTDETKQVLPPDAPHPDRPSSHLANGKFAPGNALGGRKKRSEENAMLAVLNEVLPPEKVKDHLEMAIEWAYEYKSPKLLMQVLQFHYAYTIGQPVQRSVSASGKLETLLSTLGSMDESEFNTIESVVRKDK